MVHVHSIKISFRLVHVAPIPILAICYNLIFLFLDSPGFKIDDSLNINILRVNSFSVGVGLVSVSSSSLKVCRDRIFVFIYLRKMSC